MGKASGAKQAAVVVGALAFGWMAIELALKPFLDRARAAMDKSDPSRDPDDAAAEPETTPAKEDGSDKESDADAAAEAESKPIE